MIQTLKISGMHCHHCVGAVREAIASVEGVTILEVDIGSARIDSPTIEKEALQSAIEEEGYVLEDVVAK